LVDERGVERPLYGLFDLAVVALAVRTVPFDAAALAPQFSLTPNAGSAENPAPRGVKLA
jgi:hypothetical protein